MAKQYKAVGERILGLLNEYPSVSFSFDQIFNKVGGANRGWVSKHLKKLYDEGLIYRKPGPGHSYLYSINKTAKGYQANPTKEIPEIPRVQVTPAQVRSLLKNWSERPWNPKIFQSAKFLPLAIARLFEQTHEVLYGGTVTKRDLAQIYDSLDDFKRDLVSTLTTLTSLMETEELWEPRKFFEFLMSEGAAPVDLYRDQALALKERYNASKESE